MRIKSIRMSSIILSLCEIVIGILLLVDPEGFTSGIITCLGIVLLLGGVVSVVQYFRSDAAAAAMEHGLTKGVIEIIVGAFCVVKSGWFIATFPVFTVVYGVVTLVLGIEKVQWTADMLRLKMKKWGLMAVNAVITLICAVIILSNPFSTTVVLWTFVAVSLIVEAVVDIIAAIFAKVPKV